MKTTFTDQLKEIFETRPQKYAKHDPCDCKTATAMMLLHSELDIDIWIGQIKSLVLKTVLESSKKVENPSGNCPSQPCNTKSTTWGYHPHDSLEHYGFYNAGIDQVKENMEKLLK